MAATFCQDAWRVKRDAYGILGRVAPQPVSDAPSAEPSRPARSSRRPRRRPLGLRLREILEMPRLTRAERNQRLAIAAALLAFALFLLLRPMINGLTSSKRPPAPRSAPRR